MLSPRRRATDRTGGGFEDTRDYDTRFLCSMFTSNSMGLKSGGWTVLDIIR